MSLDFAVYTTLNAAISEVIRGWLTESQSLPCAVVRYMTDRPQLTLQGEAELKNEIIAVDCWARGLEAAEALRDQVLATIDASALNAVRIATRPLHEPEQSTYRFTIEYSVWG